VSAFICHRSFVVPPLADIFAAYSFANCATRIFFPSPVIDSPHFKRHFSQLPCNITDPLNPWKRNLGCLSPSRLPRNCFLMSVSLVKYSPFYEIIYLSWQYFFIFYEIMLKLMSTWESLEKLIYTKNLFVFNKNLLRNEINFVYHDVFRMNSCEHKWVRLRKVNFTAHYHVTLRTFTLISSKSSLSTW